MFNPDEDFEPRTSGPAAKFSVSVESFDTDGFYSAMVCAAVQNITGRAGYSDNALAKQIKETALLKITERLDAALDTTLDELLARPIQAFDTFGNPVGTAVYLEEIVKNGASTFLTEPVNSDGKPARDSYGTKKSRLAWAIERQVVNGLAKMVEDEAKAVRAEVAKRAKDAVAAVLAGVK